MNTDIAKEIVKASEWLRVARDTRWAAEARLRAGGEHHEVARKRAELRGAEGRVQRAYEDLQGWRGLDRPLRARRYG
jgi:hypothetical protein